MNSIKLIIKKMLIGKRPIVIMLHSVDNPNDNCTVSFENFVSFINRFEYEIKNGRMVLTFDDGFESVYTKCFKLLLEKKLPFVCFLVSDFIDKPNYLTKQQVFEMLGTGLLTIGSHGKTHAILNKLEIKEMENEIAQSKKALEMTFGKSIFLFAYSHGIFNKKCIRMVKKTGYHFAYSATSNISNYLFFDHYKIPRYDLRDLTVNNIEDEIGFLCKKVNLKSA